MFIQRSLPVGGFMASSLLVASFVKGQGWNIQNIMIWLATFVATYITLRLLFMLFKIVRTLFTKEQ